MKFLLISTLILFAGCQVTAQNPAPNKILWTLSDSPGVISQKIYCGAETGVYTLTFDIPDGTTDEKIISELNLENGRHFCALTASNFTDESVKSNEVSFVWFNGVVIKGPPNPQTGVQVI